ncbi:tetratricopeptide repeat protein [Candidatus Aminicenantes bacterium AC-708-I09]|nr:tetratricopeptide repeat protein [Candidatus Aminicenantes bacterium AC-708-I09]
MKAEIYFRRALKKGFDRIQCYVQLLDMYINQLKFFNDGVEIESGLIKIHPALFENQKVSSLLAKATDSFKYWGPEYLYVIGLRYFEKSKGEVNSIFMRRAIDFFKLTLDLSPKFKDSLFSLGAINYNISNFREAEEYFRRILYFEPENKEVKYYLECALKKLNNSKKEESSSSCPDIINLSREFIDNPDIEYKYKFHNDITYVRENINNLALEFIEKGKFKEAMKRFKNALKIYPQCPIVNYNIGWVYFWLNDYKNAEKHALIALRRKNFYTRLPDNLSKKERNELLKMSINIHVESNIPISQWNFEVALKEGNYFPEDYNLLGNIYFKIKDYSRALLAFKKILEIDPKDPIGHYNLGCVYSALNDWRKAEEEWKKAIKYEKGVKRTEKREEISRSYLRVSLLVFKYPVAFRAHKSLGWLYLDRNLPDKALKEFEEAIKLEPGDPEPYYELGKIYFSKNNHKKAIYYFEKYLYLGGEKEKVKRILNSIKKKKVKYFLTNGKLNFNF